MVKNPSPKQMAKTPRSNKPTPQSMKKGPNKPTPGKPTPKQQFQVARTGQTPGKPPAKNFPTPKQALSFQTPKQTPKGQTPGKKPQTTGKKFSTPHPAKTPAAAASDDDFDSEDEDEEMDSDESMEDDSDDVTPAKGSQLQKPGNASAKKAVLAKPAQQQQSKQMKRPAPTEESDDEDEEDEDDDFESEEDDDEESDSDAVSPVNGAKLQKPGNATTTKAIPGKAAAKPAQQQQKQSMQKKKPAEESDDEEEEEDDDDDEDEELESEDDDEDEEESDSVDISPAKGSQLQNAGKAAKNTAAQKATTKPAQQQPKQVKRPAPAEESDDDDDEEEEDEEDEDEDEEDEDEEESESDESPKQKQASKKASATAPAQKKLKANDGTSVPQPRHGMATKLDKKLQDETEQRRRDRDRRSLFIKNLPKGTSDEQIKSLSADITYVNRRKGVQRFCWVMFANEQVCEKNYEKLKNAKLGNVDLFVDYCGEKSKSVPAKQSAADQKVDALRLYVGQLPSGTTEAELKRLFPSATSIYYPKHRQTCAFINFDKPEKARQAFENNKDAKIHGQNVVVAFARIPEPKSFPKKDAVKKFAKDQASGKVVTRG